MKIKIEKINEILDKNFLANGYNCDEQPDRILWVAAREAIKEILDECNVEVVIPKQK
jgi:hypothetical protein